MENKALFRRMIPYLICVFAISGIFPMASYADAPAANRMSFTTFANVTDINYVAVNSGGGPGKIVVRGLAVDSRGNIFISSGGDPNKWEDDGNKRADNIIRKISPAGDVSRFTTGQEKYGYGGYVAPDGNGGNYYTTRTELAERLMHCPRGIAIDSYDNLYFADQGDGQLVAQSARVVKTDRDGNLQKVFMAEDTGGHTYMNFHEIQDIAVENGILYTLNMWTDKMVVTQFKSEDASGSPVAGACVGGDFVLDGKGLSESSKGICVKDNKLYIADTGNARIIRMDVSEKDGSGYVIPRNIVAFYPGTLGLGDVSPQDVAADSQGNMYLTDSYYSGATYNYRVIMLDPNGNLLAYGGTRGEGTAPDQFNMPQQIAVGNDGKVYVADWFNYRVQVYVPEAPTVGAAIMPAEAAFDKNTAARSDVSVTITWNDATSVTDVMKSGASVGADAYSISANTLTIKKEYLAAQPMGSLILTIVFDKGNAAMLTISIRDTTRPAGNNPPVWPAGSALTAGGTTRTSTTLSWTAAEDDVEVTSYRIFKDNLLIKTVTGAACSYEVTGLSPSTTYIFRVQAGDANDRWSDGPTVTVHTDSSDTGGSGGSENNNGGGTIGGNDSASGSGGNVSGNGGEVGKGSSAPAAPGYKAEVSGIGRQGTSLSVNVNADAGSAAADLGALAQDIFSRGETATIKVPSIPGVSSYTMEMPAASMSVYGGKGALTVSTNTGSITIPANMLTGIPASEGKKASITVSQGDKSGLSAEIKAAIGDRPIVRLTMTLDGKQAEWNNPNAPVTVSIPYTPTAEELANPESIVVWYIDGSGKAFSVPNGRYDAVARAVTFTTAHFSSYAVSYKQVSFKDVPKNAWYSKAVAFTAAREITAGTGNGNFSPEAMLTRSQFIVMLMKAYEISPDAN